MKQFLLWLAAFAFVLSVANAAPSKPNVILIYTDDQGFGDMSALNPDSKFQTPHLDRLAREGILFTDGHSSDTVCTPSRYGLLTGRYNWRTTLKTGVYGAEKKGLIEDGRMTVASLLRDNGYRTAMVGKWHLGMDFPGTPDNRDWTQPVKDMPLDKGFDYFYGIPASLNYGVLAWFEGRYAKVPPTLFTKKKPNQIALSDYRIAPPYETELQRGLMEVAPDFIDSECLTRFTDKSIEWIDGHTKKSDDPFFLYLPYTSPHKPVIPLPEFRGQGEAGAYGEFMIETDHHIGRLMAYLDEAGLADDTMIIFSSDNGPETTWREREKRFNHISAGGYRGGKRDIYEGGHRVPFIVRWPAGIAEAGRRWNEPVSQLDVLATLAEMLGVSLPVDAGEDSVSFYGALKDPAHHRIALPLIHHEVRGRFAIRDGDWKLIMPEGDKPAELYHLGDDPAETRDVIAEHPEIAIRLERRITSIVARGRLTAGPVQPNDTDWWEDLSWMTAEEYRRIQAN
ncbi:arylsulfatase [Opitutaceae bacterium]|nr:arylsulfatase [Opitutaceae bacterium]